LRFFFFFFLTHKVNLLTQFPNIDYLNYTHTMRIFQYKKEKDRLLLATAFETQYKLFVIFCFLFPFDKECKKTFEKFHCNEMERI